MKKLGIAGLFSFFFLLLITGCRLFYGDVNITALSVDAPWCAGHGAAISVDVVLSNEGSAGSKTFSAGIYLSENQITDPSDLLIATVTFDTGISAMSDETVTAAIELPSDLSNGVYYVGVIADPDDELWETSETDNGYFYFFNQPITISDPEELTFTYSPGNPVFALPASTVCSTILTINGLAGGEELIMVKANASGTEAAADDTGRAASGWGEPSTRSLPAARSLGQEPGQVVLKDYGPASDFNANPPPISTSRGLSAPAGGFLQPLRATVGDTWNIWVDENGTWSTIEVKCRAVGQYCAVWIPDVNFDNGSILNNDNKLTSTQAANLAAKFDGTSGNSWEDGIYKGVTTIFGFEYGGNGSGGGIDFDPLIHMVLYDIDGDHPSYSVVGYFWAKDEYLESEMWPQYNVHSNEAEMFYLDVNYYDLEPDGMYSTMAHEFQHMIHFNKKWIEHTQDSSTWFNEMCSMVAEDFLTTNLGTVLYDSHPSGRLASFKNGYVNSGVTDWGNTSNVLENYASAYFFGAYLARNFESAGLFNDILENSSVDIDAVEAALAANGHTGETFDSIFQDYTTALVYSPPSPGISVKVFSEVIENWGGIDYTLPEFDINNSGGLRTYDPSTRVDLRPYGVSIHTSTEWSSLPSSPFTVSIERGAEQDVIYLFMIR